LKNRDNKEKQQKQRLRTWIGIRDAYCARMERQFEIDRDLSGCELRSDKRRGTTWDNSNTYKKSK